MQRRHDTVTRAAQRRANRQERRDTRPPYAIIVFSVVFVALAFIYRPASVSVTSTSRIFRPQIPIGLLDLMRTTVGSVSYLADYCSSMGGSPPKNFLRSNSRSSLVFLLPAMVFLFIGLAIVTDDYLIPPKPVVNKTRMEMIQL